MKTRKKTTERSPQEIDRYVGARIRARRKLVGLSQEELGNVIGVTFQQIQKYENGSNRIGAARLFEIAEALEVSPAWMFEGIPSAGKRKPKALDEIGSFLTDPYAARIMAAFPKLATDIKKRMIDLIESTSGVVE